MLWYNNIEAVNSIHEGLRERRLEERRRRLLRLVAAVDHADA